MTRKHLKSLREYLDALAELGDLREVAEPVDTELEIGAVIRRAVERNDPAPLFTAVTGHAPGFRVLGNPGALSSLPGARWARAALSLGLPVDSHPLEIVEELAGAQQLTPIAPVIVEDAPCQQNVLLGEDATLDAFPVPLIHDGDGGRYVNTWGAIVVRTPDGTWTNWSIARIMKVDGRTMAGMINPPQDLGKIFKLWQERGEPMPYALVQGCEPAVPFVCGMGLPSGVDEAGYLGAFFGEALETVRCKTVDLEVPASAEIVIEGHVSLDETVPEGPMGEFLGYVSGQPRQRNVFRISAITHRDDPVLPVVSAGKPVEEDHTGVGLTYSAVALTNLREAGLPVTAAWMVPESAVNLLAITVPRDWRERSAGAFTTTRMLTRALARVGLRAKVGFWLSRVLVLDDDIDPTDLRDLLWGFATRCHPGRGELRLEDERVTPLHIFYSQEEILSGSGPKTAYDCLLPWEPEKRPRSTAFKDNFTEPVRRRALELWP
ncbi:UbiD family decarboxylase [Kitasatospora sp. NPDC048407]|uniref:UbiD family decarboxylase n=1 Tax=Kitasatospora sp. NPDC048407 TaxID=3364051 RepID=UPI0037195707